MCDDFMSGEGWAVIGAMSEDIASEEMEIEKARRDTLGENYLEPEDPFTDDETFDTDFDFDPEAD
jgi:hypothetical protein